MRDKRELKSCLVCQKKFKAKQCLIKKGYGKYCSSKCYHETTKGSIPWNKGIKGTHFSPKTEFKKGQFENEKHRLWKGDDVSYSGLHYWIKRKLGRAVQCIKCQSFKYVQWANKSHEYKRDLSDWLALCRKCHVAYDKQYWGIATKRFNLH